MKKLISMILALCLMLAIGAMAEGRPTATAVLDEEAQAVIVTVDLTDGWSVEFAPGAFYLYDGEIREDESIKAIGLTLDKEVYEDYLAEAQKSESCREIENGVCYVEDDGTYYVLSVGTSAYFLLDVIDDADGGDAILERIELVNQDDYFTELAEEPEGEEDEAEAEAVVRRVCIEKTRGRNRHPELDGRVGGDLLRVHGGSAPTPRASCASGWMRSMAWAASACSACLTSCSCSRWRFWPIGS